MFFLTLQIEPLTGLVTVKAQFSAEDYTEVVISVLATDGGGLMDSAQVQVTINDVYTFRPTFVRKFFNLEVPSYAEVGRHICTLLAVDRNSGIFCN